MLSESNLIHIEACKGEQVGGARVSMVAFGVTTLLGLTSVLAASTAQATPPLQTLNLVAANSDSTHPVGSADPYTDVSIDNGATWQPAIIAGGHPYVESPGTNSWLNCVSITQSPEDSCRNNVTSQNPVRALFRYRFWLGSDFSGGQLVGDINIDNQAVFYLNGTTQNECFMGCTSQGGPISDFWGQVRNLQSMYGIIPLDSYLVSGWNTLYIELIDTGGQSGINYNVTFSVYSSSPIGLASPGSIVTFDPQGGTVGTPTATVAPNGTLSTIGFPTPQRAGYTFAGWYTQPLAAGTLANSAYASATVPTSDLTLYANWIPLPASQSPQPHTLAATGSEIAPNLLLMWLMLLTGVIAVVGVAGTRLVTIRRGSRSHS